MLLSIVITTRNRKDDLLRCIESIKNCDLLGIPYEMIVIDDASTDGTKYLSGEGFIIHHNEFQQMMVKSRNIGARMSTGKYILFVDDDNVVDKLMIKILLDFAENNPSYGILGPSMYYLDSRKKYLDSQDINLYTGKTTGLISKSAEEISQSDGIPNVFMIRKDVFERYGYFDETLIQTFTEPDFALYVKTYSVKCGIVKYAKVFHDVSSSLNLTPRALGGQFSQKAYCLMRNRSVLVQRYGTYLNKLIYLYFFSWLWPLLYTILMLKHKKYNLIRLYWLGYIDGIIYLFTGKLRRSI